MLLGGLSPAEVSPADLAILSFGILASALVEAGYAFLLGTERLRQLALATASASWVYALFVTVLWSTGGVTVGRAALAWTTAESIDRKSTRLNSSHTVISYAVFCLKKKN